MENIRDDIRIEEVCDFLKSTIKVLSKPRRIAILNVLINDGQCTFKEIKTKTGISQGSLHEHLMELLQTEFVYRTDKRPMKYGYTSLVDYLIFIAEGC